MMHIPSVIKGLKIAWVKRLLDINNNGNWKHFYSYYMCHVGGNLLWKCNVSPNDNCVKELKNVFISEVINAWCSITYDDNPTTPYDHIIWNNSLIRIENKSIYKRSWHDKGIQHISDLLDDDFNYLSFEAFKTNTIYVVISWIILV